MTRRSLFPIWLLALAIFARGLVPWVHSPIVSTVSNGSVLLTFCGSVSPALLTKAAAISPWKQGQPNPKRTPGGSTTKICPICVVAAAAVVVTALIILQLLGNTGVPTALYSTPLQSFKFTRRYDARGPPARLALSI